MQSSIFTGKKKNLINPATVKSTQLHFILGIQMLTTNIPISLEYSTTALLGFCHTGTTELLNSDTVFNQFLSL